MNTVYDTLRRPLVTEKSNYLVNRLHQYVFEVARDATRTDVKKAIEEVFDVKVVRVNIVVAPAKRGRKGRNRRLIIHRDEYKKAIITLAPDNRIPIFEGVE